MVCGDECEQLSPLVSVVQNLLARKQPFRLFACYFQCGQLAHTSRQGWLLPAAAWATTCHLARHASTHVSAQLHSYCGCTSAAAALNSRISATSGPPASSKQASRSSAHVSIASSSLTGASSAPSSSPYTCRLQQTAAADARSAQCSCSRLTHRREPAVAAGALWCPVMHQQLKDPGARNACLL